MGRSEASCRQSGGSDWLDERPA